MNIYAATKLLTLSGLLCATTIQANATGGNWGYGSNEALLFQTNYYEYGTFKQVNFT